MASRSGTDLIGQLHSDIVILKTAMAGVQTDVRALTEQTAQLHERTGTVDDSTTRLAEALLKVADSWSQYVIKVEAQEARLDALEGLAKRVEAVEQRLGIPH
jgi:hypothetical protein